MSSIKLKCCISNCTEDGILMSLIHKLSFCCKHDKDDLIRDLMDQLKQMEQQLNKVQLQLSTSTHKFI